MGSLQIAIFSRRLNDITNRTDVKYDITDRTLI